MKYIGGRFESRPFSGREESFERRKHTGYISKRSVTIGRDSIAYQSDAEGHIVLRVRRIKGRLAPCASGPECPAAEGPPGLNL